MTILFFKTATHAYSCDPGPPVLLISFHKRNEIGPQKDSCKNIHGSFMLKFLKQVRWPWTGEMAKQIGVQLRNGSLVGSKKEHTTGVHIHQHGWPTKALPLAKEDLQRRVHGLRDSNNCLFLDRNLRYIGRCVYEVTRYYNYPLWIVLLTRCTSTKGKRKHPSAEL